MIRKTLTRLELKYTTLLLIIVRYLLLFFFYIKILREEGFVSDFIIIGYKLFFYLETSPAHIVQRYKRYSQNKTR